MPRRTTVPRKLKYEVVPENKTIDRFVVKVMLSGKRGLAERILRETLVRLETQANRPGLEVLDLALRNATPLIEVKPRRVGGATYQVPVEIRGERRLSLGVRWLVQAARKRNGKSMSDKLAEIIATKHLEVAALMPRAALLRAGALQRNDFGGFRAAIDRGPGRLGVIAEVKKASPSVGLIDPDFDPVRQAKRYLDGGASCLSILTDEKYFQGSLAYLSQISKFSDAPLLRKDFMIHEVQIHEAVVTGADAILLIVAALDDETLRRLYDEAKSFSLDVLVEVHDLREMERALELGADLIGVNNRNLKTFAVDLATTEQLAEEVPDDVLLVSESGIKSLEDAQRVLDAGANAVLIGEALMRAHDPSREIEAYLALESV